MELPQETLLEMQRRMLRIRCFDERASKMVKRGQIPGTVHTSIGQEAQVVGACMALGDNDYMSGNHRSHGHPIGKGAPLGPADGRAGRQVRRRLQGQGRLAAPGRLRRRQPRRVRHRRSARSRSRSVPACRRKVLDNGRVALAFFGDGAANQGNLYEGLNMPASGSCR